MQVRLLHAADQPVLDHRLNQLPQNLALALVAHAHEAAREELCVHVARQQALHQVLPLLGLAQLRGG